MAAPAMTLGTTLHTSASLAASGTATDTLDASAKFEAQVMYKVTAGGTVAATFGVRIDVFEVYSSTTYGDAGTATANPNFTYTVTGYTASQVAYSPKIFVPTGKWKFKITNLDATNAVTAVEAIYDTVDSIA
jgi:hypothetical protein